MTTKVLVTTIVGRFTTSGVSTSLDTTVIPFDTLEQAENAVKAIHQGTPKDREFYIVQTAVIL